MSAGRRFFVFIRAINVGHQRLTNDRLIEPFVRLGFEEVAAYQASGNVTFRTSDPAAALTDRLGAALTDAYGFDAQVFVRSTEELRAIADRRPFSDEELSGTEGRVQVSFLRDEPADRIVADVLALAGPDDRIEFSGREWFWLPRTDVAASRLAVATIERLVGPTTMRALGTVNRMLSKFDG